MTHYSTDPGPLWRTFEDEQEARGQLALFQIDHLGNYVEGSGLFPPEVVDAED
jgi:hypothetical protein